MSANFKGLCYSPPLFEYFKVVVCGTGMTSRVVTSDKYKLESCSKNI